MKHDGPAIRTIIVDDETPARDRLRELLHPLQDIEIVAEAEDGEQAIEVIVQEKPDLIFLDIQMPGCNGLEVAASLPSPLPKIIFCTAYDQHAIEAFELHAVDYLLKPVNRVRLSKAIEHIKTLENPEPRLRKAAEALEGGGARFLAKRANRFRVLGEEEILYFQSEEGLTKAHTREEGYWMEPSLSDLESRLSRARFFRVSRQAVVNLDALKEVVPLVGGHGEVRLSDGTKLEVSRRRMKELMERLGK